MLGLERGGFVRGLFSDSMKRPYRALRSYFELRRYSAYDFRRYSAHSSTRTVKLSVAQGDAELTKLYHSVEKGLTLVPARPGFGAVIVEKLVAGLSRRLAVPETWTQTCGDGIDALIGYRAFNAQAGLPPNPEVDRLVAASIEKKLVPGVAPIKRVRRADIQRAIDFDARAFFWSRHSVREFSPGPLDMKEFLAAIDLARSSPSVCNRQSGRVRYVVNDGGNLQFLKHQNGNRGFGSTAQAILIITSELSAFVDATERYQGWIDGGMFAMSVILGLHAKGFGACCLNWSQGDAADLALRKDLDLAPSETVIMLIAAGNMPEEFSVARSHRLPAEQVIGSILPRFN